MTKKNRWLIATNTENLKNIIAQGLITEPSGFSKYYKDALEISPGILIAFNNAIPKEIFDKSIEEESSLDQCIIELSFDNISGPIEYFQELVDNKVSKSVIDDDLFIDKVENKDSESINEIHPTNILNIEDIHNSPKAIYVQLPLPLSTIKNVIFNSKKIKEKFISEVTHIPNIPLIDFTLKIEAKLFKTFSKIPIDKSFPSQKEIDYSLVYAYGGLLAMLFYYAKNGKLTNKIFHSMSDLLEVEGEVDENIKWICNYFRIGNKENILPLYQTLLDVIKNGKDVKDEIIQTLETYSEDKYKKRTQELANILIEFVQNPKKTTSEYFSEAKKPLERWLLMLFFKERSEDLIEYPTSNKVIDFTEEDYVLFSMIFGIRDKFINLATELREFQGLQKFISLKMASYAHKLKNNEIQVLIKKQDEPLTLSDMFEKREFKTLFSKQNQLDCITSTLKIPKGSRTEHNKDSVLHFNGNLHEYIELNFDDKRLYEPLLKRIISKEEYKKHLTQYQKI